MIVACVRTGDRYGIEYVQRLRNMVSRHLKLEYAFVCLTDQPERLEAVVNIDVSEMGLGGWWSKMLLFEPKWRASQPVIYFDLDTLIINDLSPLTAVRGEFAILESPVRLAGNRNYPCAYNSSVMTIGGGMAGFIWERFDKQRDHFIAKHARYGDQACIEQLYPGAPLLQRRLPGFFLNYRVLTMRRPQASVSVINFGGANKPDNCPIPWVKEEWR